ncbi:MAG: hypothetical protein KGL39_21020 [Patescibacteria group bacterium]|nr:hypothetical protein [Patescibacteria group bacterium]
MSRATPMSVDDELSLAPPGKENNNATNIVPDGKEEVPLSFLGTCYVARRKKWEEDIARATKRLTLFTNLLDELCGHPDVLKSPRAAGVKKARYDVLAMVWHLVLAEARRHPAVTMTVPDSDPIAETIAADRQDAEASAEVARRQIARARDKPTWL